MGLEIENLEWDSNFFGFPVGKIVQEIEFSNQLEQIYQKTDLNLVYYFTKVEMNEDLLKSRYFNIILVDAKVAIHKQLNKKATVHPKVEVYKEEEVDPELMRLALTAGLHSRFFKDKNISHSKSKELYEIWIAKSVKRILADIVLVYREKGKIIGFMTILTQGIQPHVSLLAVDPQFEGRGVSFALMNSMEGILLSKGFNVVKSETQDQNKKALSIYRRQGVEFGEKHFVYHFWRNKVSNL